MNSSFSNTGLQICSLDSNYLNNNFSFTYKFNSFNKYLIIVKFTFSSTRPLIINLINRDTIVKTYSLSDSTTLTISNEIFDTISLFNISHNNLHYIKIIEYKNIFEEIPNIVPKKFQYITSILKDTSTSTYSNLNIGCILDEFSYNCFKFEANLFNLNYNFTKDYLDSLSLDLLLVESAYNGNDYTWVNKITNTNGFVDTKLQSLVKYCNKNKIPTIFWNKEGSINFDYFKYSSSLFDYIFTTDETIIDEQISISNHNNIHTLSFACQPKIHNSIDKNKFFLGDIAFAGGWYSSKHSNRLKDFDNIIKPCLSYDFDIFDRNYHQRDILKLHNLDWPNEYKNNIVGKLDYLDLVNTHKNYNIFLNVNSIHDSKIMTSRRLYEILASKTSIISSYSKASYNLFNSFIDICYKPEETTFIVDDILSNSDKYSAKCKLGQRFVLNQHTYQNRLEFILDTINFDYKKPPTPHVLILYFINSSFSLESAYITFKKQSYKNKSLEIIDLSIVHDLNVYINNLLELTNFDYVCIFKDDFLYFDNYISDYINILKCKKINIIGKSNIFKFIDENAIEKIYSSCETSSLQDNFCNSIFTGTSIISKDYFKTIDNYNSFIKNKVIHSSRSDIFSDDFYNVIYIGTHCYNLNLTRFIELSIMNLLNPK